MVEFCYDNQIDFHPPEWQGPGEYWLLSSDGEHVPLGYCEDEDELVTRIERYDFVDAHQPRSDWYVSL